MKRLLAGLLAGVTVMGLTACGAPAAKSAVQAGKLSATVDGTTTLTETSVQNAAQWIGRTPKYVFLFIGDGMSYPQFQAASDYLGAVADPDYMQAEPSVKDRQGAVLDGPKELNFMNFDVAGSAVTYDSCSFAPDSASTATSIATGHKTYSGMINTDETGTVAYETIAEKLHAQKGWKVGVISSVNLNHATPAAFYAHQASRNNYYEIGQELVESSFEYFAGGALKKPTGNNKDQTSLYDLAEEAGYKVTYTQADAAKVTAKDKKV
ncbi:MAG: alkaline phosphatase, partial [Oscillospiraceae bacterium]|nr:alkaline phosphatase [Oscillospiraceae bacterium]